LKWMLCEGTILTLGVTEELISKTSADVTITLGLTYSF